MTTEEKYEEVTVNFSELDRKLLSLAIDKGFDTRNVHIGSEAVASFCRKKHIDASNVISINSKK